jgi:hypothetical protein
LSYRDVQELLVERGIAVDHLTVYRWVRRFTPLLGEMARPCRRAIGNRWQVDETYVKVAGRWRDVYRAIDQAGQVMGGFVSHWRPLAASLGGPSPRPAPSRSRSSPTGQRPTRSCGRSCCLRRGSGLAVLVCLVVGRSLAARPRAVTPGGPPEDAPAR